MKTTTDELERIDAMTEALRGRDPEEVSETRQCACHIVCPCKFCYSLEPHENELIDNGGVHRVLSHREMEAYCERTRDTGKMSGFDGPDFDTPPSKAAR